MGKLRKLLSMGSKPNSSTFPELPDMIMWIRMMMAFLYGIGLGMQDTVGAPGIFYGFNFITFFPIFYLVSFLDADTDSYKGLLFSGVPNAFALMLLVWLYLFTLAHEQEGNALGTALVTVAQSTGDGGAESAEASSAEVQPGGEADEF